MTQTWRREGVAVLRLGTAVGTSYSIPRGHKPVSTLTSPSLGYTDAYCGTGCQSSFGKCWGRSPAATAGGAGYTVAGVGSFTRYSSWNFASLTSLPTDLKKSEYNVTDQAGNPNAKYNHWFQAANVAVSGGYLQLKVPGGQKTGPIKSAEVGTCATNIVYASTRVVGIMGNSAGTVCGRVFLLDENVLETKNPLYADIKVKATSITETESSPTAPICKRSTSSTSLMHPVLRRTLLERRVCSTQIGHRLLTLAPCLQRPQQRRRASTSTG